MEGGAAPVLTMTATNNTFSCELLSMWDPWPTTYNSIISTLDANKSTIGGLMYFQTGVTGTLSSTLNTYK